MKNVIHMAWDDIKVFCGKRLFEGLRETHDFEKVTCKRCLAGKGRAIRGRLYVMRPINDAE